MTAADSSTVVDLAVSAGLFLRDDAAIVEQMMLDYATSGQRQGHRCVIDIEDGVPGGVQTEGNTSDRGAGGGQGSRTVGVAYYEPAPVTDRAWYLTMIAVRRGDQGRGRGTALMRHIEHDLRANGQRLLLVETSGTPEFDRTRAFYAGLGYEREARVRDYYTAGDDMILFRKLLAD